MSRPHSSHYRVKKGDSLWKIAQSQYGDAQVWPLIAKANRLPRPDLLLIGMRLHLPNIEQPRASFTTTRPSVPSPSLERPPLAGGPPPIKVSQPVRQQTTEPAMMPARALRFPAIGYDLGDLAPIVVETPELEITLSFTGELTLQKNETVGETEFKTGNVYSVSSDGNVSASMKAEYDSKLSDLAGEIKIRPNLQTKKVDVSCGFAVAGKVDGKVLSTSQFEVVPPNGFKFTYKPRPISGDYKGFAFDGEVGYEVEIKTKNPPEATRRVPVPMDPNRAVIWIAAGGLIVAGIAVFVVDAVKDVGTLGAGAVESPVSWAFAIGLFARAGVMLH
jgi:LysM domain